MDIFYNTSYSWKSVWTYPEQDPILDTHYRLEGLDPCSLYFVLVIAENGVSSQAGGQTQRSVGGFLETIEGSKLGKERESIEGQLGGKDGGKIT